jgi:molybdopterin converting factor small subunit
VTVTVTLPTMLSGLIGGARTVDASGDTVGGVLEDLFRAHPALRVHVLDERGDLRPHVRCFHGDAVVGDLARPVRAGDEVTILQAVSGG